MLYLFRDGTAQPKGKYMRLHVSPLLSLRVLKTLKRDFKYEAMRQQGGLKGTGKTECEYEEAMRKRMREWVLKQMEYYFEDFPEDVYLKMVPGSP